MWEKSHFALTRNRVMWVSLENESSLEKPHVPAYTVVFIVPLHLHIIGNNVQVQTALINAILFDRHSWQKRLKRFNPK